MTIDELVELVTDLARTTGRKEMHCGEGVIEELERKIPPNTEIPPFFSLATLMGVDIIIDHDGDPFAYRIVRHNCVVMHPDEGEAYVSHAICPTIKEGTLST